MRSGSFLYRQKQKLKYHLANSDIAKLIAEINRFEEQIIEDTDTYFVKELNIKIPKKHFDFVFTNYPLFVFNAKNLNGKYICIGEELLFQWDNYKINVTSASEIFIINEIFVEKCYQFILPEKNKDVVIFDIGMNVGLASLFFSNMNSVKQIYGFEPFKPTYEKAIRNFAINKGLAEKITPMNFGLGATDKEIDVPYSSSNTGVNSTVNANNRKLESLSIEKILIKDVYPQLDQLIKNHSEAQIVLKIDTEGAEYEIFERLFFERLWSQTVLIMLEWHYKSPIDIEQYLSTKGFSMLSTVLNKNAGLIYAFRPAQR